MGKSSSEIIPTIVANLPKPSFIISESNFSLIWFGSTNHFLLVQGALEVFFIEALAKTEVKYQEALETLIRMHPHIIDLIQTISIDNTNSLVKNAVATDFKPISLDDFESSRLKIGDQMTKVFYASKELQILFEAPFEYLKINNKCNKELTILEIDNHLSLLVGKKLIYNVRKDQYFVLQAQFANKIIEFYHSINKSDWLCSFHGCAVQKNNKTFLLLGNSGAGKSTLSCLLSLFDYRFIADDLVLMDHDFKIYDNPAAVSVKENSWPVIENYNKAFANLNKSKKVKGQTKMKFLPLHALQNNKPKSFKVDALIWVNFSKDKNDNLVPLNKKEVLSKLIPDTWIYPEPNSAKAFANWAFGIKAYHLDYSDFIIAKELLDAKI